MPEARERRLAAIDVRPGAAMESQSGLQMMRPRIYGAYEEASCRRVDASAHRTGAIVMHPTSNFMGHYLIGPLAERGITCLGLNSRFAGNDTVLVMERVLQDLGAGVKFVREALGCDRVVLVGNSGGAALAAYYQAEAERFSVETLVDGDPSGLVAADLPPVDGIALCAAHEGRSHLLLRWIDPSVVDEHDALSVEPSLDMYDARHWADGADAAPRFRPEFLARFAAAQRARRDRIEARVRARLAELRATPGAPRDESFVVHRTHADPRCLDLTLDPNDRRPGSVWGDARAVNYSANAMGRTTSLAAFLSQWSSASRAGGPENLARTSLPVLLLTYTADQSTFPSTCCAWLAAAPGRIRNVDIVGGDHYLAGRPDLQLRVADEIAAFAEAL
jgi:pimeloyl-ACP methyl ester carboxylesterase